LHKNLFNKETYFNKENYTLNSFFILIFFLRLGKDRGLFIFFI